MEKVQLELENQEMEKKLQEFQSTRNKEKEERGWVTLLKNFREIKGFPYYKLRSLCQELFYVHVLC